MTVQKFHPGDVIQIKYFLDGDPEPAFGWCHPHMDAFSGQVFKITSIAYSGRVYFENMPEEMKGWSWGEDMIEPCVGADPTKEEMDLWNTIVQ